MPAPLTFRAEADWFIGEPDLKVTTPSDFTMYPAGPDWWIDQFAEVQLTEDRWIKSMEIKPSNPKIVHHVVVYAIEPDASSAHYFLAAAALSGGRVRVRGLHRQSLQGDVRFADLLEQMGASVRWEADAIEVSGPARLAGIDADLNAISDTAPTLAAIAPFASAPVHIRNVAHLRWQESDRLRAVATELSRLGVRVEERDDGISVWPSPIAPAAVHTYDDHRIAMAFALIGLKVDGIRIEDPDCVSKTFPDYFARLEALRS
jgi:3-phosphoshikimate 1-carboxyvinyltransferase